MSDTTNMLQVMTDGLAAAERSMQPLARVCLVGRFEQAADRSQFAKSCHEQFDALEEEKRVTGLLLTLPTGWILLGEGPHASLRTFLRSTNGQMGTMFEGIKVIHSSEDVPRRHFQTWGAKDADAVRNNYAEVDAKTLPGLLGDTAIGAPRAGDAGAALRLAAACQRAGRRDAR